MRAILLVSHGSYSSKTKDEISVLTDRLRKRRLAPIIEYAFLEIEQPSIPEGIDLCKKKGAKEIIILLNFLNSGKHVDEDIPQILREARKKYPDVKILMTQPITRNQKIVDLFADLIKQCTS